MHEKIIRLRITDQLKKNFPDWKKMTKKVKKELIKEIMIEVADNYDYSQSLDIPTEKLIGIEEQAPTEGIRSLPEMASYIEKFHFDNMFYFDTLKKPYPEIVDRELQFVDQLIDDQIINSLIAPAGYSPAHREIQPYQLFRMELLKIIKYPEISYRKFCSDEYFGRERKQNRRFVRLPLNTKLQADHTELCHFRHGLDFKRLMNVLVYFLHYFYKTGCLESAVIHGVDSSELPSEINYPLCTIQIKGKKIRIYSDPDCDCGKRRNKRDKSYYVIGYRLHTLTAINSSTGHSFPLVSLVGAANHHDSLFLNRSFGDSLLLIAQPLY